MSTRAMARAYSGGGGGGGNLGGGIWDFLARVTGQDKVEGGDLTTTPEGVPTGVNPFKAKGGFFSGPTQRYVAGLNAHVMPQMAEIITDYHKALLEAQTAKERDQINNEYREKIQNSMNASAERVAQIREQGPVNLAKTQGQLQYAKEHDLTPTQSTTDLEKPSMDNALAMLALRSGAMKAPGSQEAATAGFQAQERAPLADEYAKTSLLTPENSIRTIPDASIFGGNPPGMVLGPRSSVQQVPMGKDKNGNPIYFPMQGTTPGSFQPGAQPIPQANRDQVLNAPPSPVDPLTATGNNFWNNANINNPQQSPGPTLSTPQQQKQQDQLRSTPVDDPFNQDAGPLIKQWLMQLFSQPQMGNFGDIPGAG